MLLTQNIGENFIAHFPAAIATFLGLPDAATYTSHAIRRTAATLLADSGVGLLELKRAGSWLSSAVAEEYIDKSMPSKTKIANSFNFGKEDSEPSEPPTKKQETSVEGIA